MNRILVPIDFSADCGNTLRYAHDVALDRGMKLTLLHCYPSQPYNRIFDFKDTAYEQGSRNKLKEFYAEWVGNLLPQTRFLAQEGSFVKKITQLSPAYESVFLNGNAFNSILTRWIGGRTLSIASNAKCPVMIVPASAQYKKWTNVWHVKRRDKEEAIVGFWMEKLKVEPEMVNTKSFDQQSFTSRVWKSIVEYTKHPEESIRQQIIKEKTAQKVDLLLLVSYQEDTFEKFVNHGSTRIIFQIDLPIMICQSDSVKK